MRYYIELLYVLIIRSLSILFPKKLRYHFVRTFYGYQSNMFSGVKMVIPYKIIKGYYFMVNTKNLIDWNVFFMGEYEAPTNRILKEHIKPGYVVLEAGANNGTETLLISYLVGEKGKVYAFEPIPHVVRELNYNLGINKITNTVVVTDALGETEKDVVFSVLPENFCNQGMSSKYDQFANAIQLNVHQITLDEWVLKTNVSQLDFIKMDIQGAEIDLLTGAKRTISKFKPVIFSEASGDDDFLTRLYNAFVELNYRPCLIQKEGHTEMKKPQSGNWIVFPN